MITYRGPETVADSIALDSVINKNNNWQKNDFGVYKTIKSYDSVQELQPASEKDGRILRWINHKAIEIKQKADKEENYKEKFKETMFHNLPKALFLYMPFFALGLWIFHSKKKWYYFDHGIFTLHYFSFLLFTFSINSLINSVTDQIDNIVVNTFDGLRTLFLFGWWFFYFFRSHRRFYGESRAVSRAKGFALFCINMFFITIFILVLAAISALTVH